MTNDERDKKISETHTAVMIMTEKVNEHNTTLYGNGRPGLSKDVTLLQERQENCPARTANTVGNKKLTVAIITGIVAGVAFAVNFILELVKWKHESP